MMDLGWNSSVLALWIFVFYTISLCFVRGFGISNQIRPLNNRNCTTPPCKKVFHLTFAEKVRIDMLKKHIMNELNIQDKTVQNAKLIEKETKNLPQKDKTPQTQPVQELPEMAEIVSFSEKPGLYIVLSISSLGFFFSRFYMIYLEITNTCDKTM